MNSPNKDELIYLASLYSLNAARRPALKQARYERVLRVAALMIKDDWKVFSPIVHCHTMSLQYELPSTFDFWRKIDEVYISHSDRLCILTDKDWQQSEGITGEIEIAKAYNKPISLVEYNDEEYSYKIVKFTLWCLISHYSVVQIENLLSSIKKQSL